MKSVTNYQKLLKLLKQVRWNTAAKTYGSNHATLVGILVDWWISIDPDSHWVLESGTTNGYKKKGMRGQCDALLCDSNGPVGVLEVEGSRHRETVKKIGFFFKPKDKDIKGIRFSILFMYTYECEGRGDDRHFLPAAVPEALIEAKKVTRNNKNKPIIVITLDKKYERNVIGIRSRNKYYIGTPEIIEGRFYRDGVLLKHTTLWKGET